MRVSEEQEPIEYPECPYPEDIFTMTQDEYVKSVPDDYLRTRISGYLMREGWNVADRQYRKIIQDSNVS